MQGKPLHVGLHIQKCAGTTLQTHIAECPRAGSWFWHTSADVNYRNSSLEIDVRNTPSQQTVQIIWGHEVFDYFLRFFVDRPIYLFTFLRHPAKRIVSWYKYEARGYEKSRGTLEGFDLFGKFLVDKQNHMCHFIVNRFPHLDVSGSEILHKRAISILEKFAFIGLQEDFQTGANNLLNFMGLPLITGNVRKNVDDGNLDLEYNMDEIIANNSQDMALYEYVLERYLQSSIPDTSRVVNPIQYNLTPNFDNLQNFIQLRGKSIVNRMKEQKLLNSYQKDNVRQLAQLLIHQCLAENNPEKQKFYQEFDLNLSEQEIQDIPKAKAVL
jgi:Sulfotransferase family